MQRLVDAFLNSARAWRHLIRHEAAFRQEMILLALAIPLGRLLASSWPGYALLIGSLLVLIMVEVLNTAIEAACNAATRDFSPDIQIAKDCGSLAVSSRCCWRPALGAWRCGSGSRPLIFERAMPISASRPSAATANV